jgi:hypothetical protein
MVLNLYMLLIIPDYDYAGAAQAIIFNDLTQDLTQLISDKQSVSILVSPNFYPYAGLFVSDEEVYHNESLHIYFKLVEILVNRIAPRYFRNDHPRLL